MPPKVLLDRGGDERAVRGGRLRDPHSDALQLGFRQMTDALELIARCEDEGNWPGYAPEVQCLTCPRWVYGRAQ
jgi:hypothetical protein